MSEFEIISLSAIGGGFISQIGSKLIDKFIRDKRADRGVDIHHLEEQLNLTIKMVNHLNEVVAKLEDLACYHDVCDMRIGTTRKNNIINIQ